MHNVIAVNQSFTDILQHETSKKAILPAGYILQPGKYDEKRGLYLLGRFNGGNLMELAFLRKNTCVVLVSHQDAVNVRIAVMNINKALEESTGRKIEPPILIG